MKENSKAIQCAFSEVDCDGFFDFPNVQEVITEYTKLSLNVAESDVSEATTYSKENYRQIYSHVNDELAFCIEHVNGKAIGIIILRFDVQAHLGFKVASIDTGYCLERYRSSGAGKALLNACFDLAKKHGAKGLYLIAQHNSRLEKVYQRLFTQTDSLFFKEL